MSLPRRRFLRIAGGGAVVAAAGSAAWLAAGREPASALSPWVNAGQGYRDPRAWALSWAILAPNAHNLQSWQVDLSDPDVVVLHIDPERLLPETDPWSRQIMISMGCFLEILRMAAAERGYEAIIERFPHGEPGPEVGVGVGVGVGPGIDRRPVARIALRERSGVPADPLFRHVRDRRSGKAPYDTDRPLEAAALEAIRATSLGTRTETVTDPGPVGILRDLSHRAFDLEYRTAAKHRESVDLMRIGRGEIERSPDGIALRGAMIEVLRLLGQIDRERLATPGTAAWNQGLRMYREMLAATPGYAWIATPGNTRGDQLDAGRDYVRINLRATALGLSLHPVSQALQEYVEMAPLYDELHRELGVQAPARVQMLARLGYGPRVPAAPRWDWQQRTI